MLPAIEHLNHFHDVFLALDGYVNEKPDVGEGRDASD